MNYIQKFNHKLLILAVGISTCLFTSNAFASNANSPSTVIDNATGSFISVWNETDPVTGFSRITANSTTNPSNATPLTTSFYNASKPVLAGATGFAGGSNTVAAAAWFAYDFTTGFYIIQVGVLRNGSWQVNDVSANGGSDFPNQDYKVYVSYDGSYVAVTWSSYHVAANDTVVFITTSTDGGATWNTNQQISN